MRYLEIYKLKNKNDLWALVKDVKAKGRINVKNVLKKIYTKSIDSIDINSEEYEKELDICKCFYLRNADEQTKIYTVHKKITEEYSKSLIDHNYNEYNFDVRIDFLEYYKNKIYLISNCTSIMQNTLNFLDRDNRIEYCDDMESIFTNDTFLSLDICSISSFYKLNPYLDFSRKILES